MMTTEQWALCWSCSQNALHTETLAQHTSANRAAYADNRPGDYRLLLVGTRAEVDATAASIRPTMMMRDLGRARVAA
jgi:hypothetical protein